MSHKFTLRESLLLLLCAIVGLGLFYYEIVYKGFERSLEQYNVENLESEVMIYQQQLAKKKQMETYLEEHKNDTYGEIALYNNLANEIAELGRILNGVDNLSISWADPTLTGTTVRRNANISFTTVGYSNVTTLLRRINSSTYRLLISDLSVSTNRDEVLSDNSEIKVNLKVTFFERIDETTNLDGLTILGE